MSILDDFQRVSKDRPCPVCKRPDWCLICGHNPDDPSRVICERIESPMRFGSAGWLHRLRDDGWQPTRVRQRTIRLKPPRSTQAEFSRLAGIYRAAIEPSDLAVFAGELGVSVASLNRLGVGWATAAELKQLNTACKGEGCWTFPMVDADGVVLGIRLRTRDGFKYAIRGGRQGLFVPEDLPNGYSRNGSGSLLICEGPTDTAAMLDLGFDTIGRPNCDSGTDLVVKCVQSQRPYQVVLVADHDAPGQRGAEGLASGLLPYCSNVRVINPPENVKDARAWVLAGATCSDIQAAIKRAPVRHLTVQRNSQYMRK